MSPHDVYAEAVHRAVTDALGDVDISGYAMAGTFAGWVLLSAHPPGPGPWHPQGGSLIINPNPDFPTAGLGYLAADGGVRRGEFHAWLAHEDGGRIDFAARYYRRYVKMTGPVRDDGVGAEGVRWNRPDPPAYLWAHYRDFPDWIFLVADLESSRAIWEDFRGGDEVYDSFRHLVLSHYNRLIDAS